MPSIPWTLSPDRCLGAAPARRAVARGLYATVKDLPLVALHDHVSPALHADGLRHVRPTFRPDAVVSLASASRDPEIRGHNAKKGQDHGDSTEPI